MRSFDFVHETEALSYASRQYWLCAQIATWFIEVPFFSTWKSTDSDFDQGLFCNRTHEEALYNRESGRTISTDERRKIKPLLHVQNQKTSLNRTLDYRELLHACIALCFTSPTSIKEPLVNAVWDVAWHAMCCMMLHKMQRGHVIHLMTVMTKFVFHKSDLYLVALLWKTICNLGDPMSLGHPVSSSRDVRWFKIFLYIWMFHDIYVSWHVMKHSYI